MSAAGRRLGLTRVAYGCQSLDDIIAREPSLLEGDPATPHVCLNSARIPRRDLTGGSIFWIVRHMLIARQPILRVVEIPVEGRTTAEIHLQPGPIPVVPRVQRSHQGWRYLPEELWPADSDGGESEALPPELAAKLAELSLI